MARSLDARHPNARRPSIYRRSDDLAGVRESVASRSSEQGGVFRREHLILWGHDDQLLPVMVRRGWWLRLQYGVYVDRLVLDAAMANPKEFHLLLAAAAIQARSMPVHAFGITAALLHDLPLPDDLPDVVDLIRDVGADRRGRSTRTPMNPGLRKVRVRCHDLRADRLTQVRGLPSVDRSMAGLSAAAEFSVDWAVAILDSVVWGQPTLLGDLGDLLAEWPMLKGIGVARKALPQVRTGAQTPLESHSRVRLVRAGLPEPQLQVPMHDRAGLIGRVDMYWPDLGVVGEADGAIKYEVRDDLLKEKAREDRLRALGLAVVRWTWPEIWQDPGEVARRVRQASLGARRFAG